jgi:hypothetical protein
MILFRTLWKDWGFAASIFAQAKHFLELAKASADPGIREGYARASIVFFIFAFEAYFFEVVRGYIQVKRAIIDPAALKKVEDGFQHNTGIREAVRDWPKVLTGQSLDTNTEPYQDLLNFIKYRNALVHGKITEPIPSWGKLAQDVETPDNADHARRSISAMTFIVSAHFGFDAPNWAAQ